jgi:hypothetical protein
LAGSSNSTLASYITVQKEEYNPVPSTCSRGHSSKKKQISLELLHCHLGHQKCCTLLAASEHNLWADTAIQMSPESHCLSCGIATIRATARSNEPHSAASKPGEYAFLDIQQPIVSTGLTPSTTYAFYLFVVDAYSRYTRLYGIPTKSSSSVITALKRYSAECINTCAYEYINLERIRVDAGSQFMSETFMRFCTDNLIKLSIVAPKKQNQNHLAKRNWQTICGMARSLLVHARLPDTFWYHALCYASDISNVLPIRGHTKDGDVPTTPYEILFGKLPFIHQFRVFGSPVIIKRWTTPSSTTGKQTERGTRGIFVGFPSNQKGYLIYSPHSQQLLSLMMLFLMNPSKLPLHLLGNCIEIPLPLYQLYHINLTLMSLWNTLGQLKTSHPLKWRRGKMKLTMMMLKKPLPKH